ncbi:MAG TPA: hypothetical protein PK239_14640 [Chitinophagales bacterium]|nr:hypothetical protein [Chitinophagales bacterium]HRK28511.1 hypothetical protein [Chitinophagales bacterium]
MKQLLGVFFFSFLMGFTCTMQAQPVITWQTTYGNFATDEQAESLIQMPDGGFAVAGYTGSPFNYDYHIVRFNANREILWQTITGGTDIEKAYDLAATPDGGIVAVGYSQSADGDVGINFGGIDCWVVKLSASGSIQWSKVLGGLGEDFFRSVLVLPDGNIVITGHSDSTNGDFTDNLGFKDLWVLKLSSANGDIIWKRNYGGSANDTGADIAYHTTLNQLWVIGATSSTDGNVTLNKGSRDVWLLKLDANGLLLWQKTYGGTLGDTGTALAFTPDGGVVFMGDSISSDGDLTQNFGADDMWLVRIDATGNIVWQRTIGAPASDTGRGIVYDNTSGNVYGMGINYDHTVLPPNYIWDVNVVKLNGNNGNIIWTQLFGGSLYDFGNGLIQNSFGNLMIAGYTDSTDGDLGGGYRQQQPVHGNHDVWFFEVSDYPVGIQENALPYMPMLKYMPQLQAIQITRPLPPTTVASLMLADMQGRTLLHHRLPPHELAGAPIALNTARNLPAGIYLATLYAANKYYVIKVHVVE